MILAGNFADDFWTSLILNASIPGNMNDQVQVPLETK